jgi:hypothetical protein
MGRSAIDTNIRKWPLINKWLKVSKIPAVANGLMSERQAAYCIAHKGLINPNSKPITGLYFAAGPDIATPLLTFDPSEIVAVDDRKLELHGQEESFRSWQNDFDGTIAALKFNKCIEFRRNYNYWMNPFCEQFGMNIIAYELHQLGVDLAQVRFRMNADGNIEMDFPWAYPNRKPVMRRFTYIHADITRPKTYPESLKRLLVRGELNFFYQKCAMSCIESAEYYIPSIIGSITDSIVISPAIPATYDPKCDAMVLQLLSPCSVYFCIPIIQRKIYCDENTIQYI